MAFNVMVVDDSDVIRAMITRTLHLAAVPVGEVHHASNGREALRVLDETWIDLVLADINMPVMNGEEMIEQMRSRPETADVPVIVVSTEGATERVSHLLDNSVTAWIRKPFTPEQIRNVIADVTAVLPSDDMTAAHVDAVIGTVLETFAFAFPESIEEAAAPDGNLMCATISFTGATSGSLSVCAPEGLCAELTANILGTEIDDPDARHRGADTLGEVANICAGHIATRIEPASQTDLMPPVVTRMDQPAWERLAASPAARTYLVDGQPILVTLSLRPAKAN